MHPLVESAIHEFEGVFGALPTAYAIAPGRVEVLGNHTDYNEGFILSAAIDRYVVIVGRPIAGDTAKLYAKTFGAGETIHISRPAKVEVNAWVNYPAGVVEQLRNAAFSMGAFEALILSDVPLGAGLSSSAALEVATANFLQALFPFEMDPVTLALLCQRAENSFVGVNCGILDQFSSCMGKKDHLIFLDCRNLDRFDHIPLGTDVELVLADTHATHQLADGTYNRLREDCFAAATHFNSVLQKNVSHLRDVTPEELEEQQAALEESTFKRARHVVSENARVQRGIEGLRSGVLAVMGDCMFGSHASSRDDFGNSCKELDVMVDCAREIPGCFGARLSGGGFGGCTVNLVEAGAAEAFAEALKEKYHAATGLKSDMHICRAVDGASHGSVD